MTTSGVARAASRLTQTSRQWTTPITPTTDRRRAVESRWASTARPPAGLAVRAAVSMLVSPMPTGRQARTKYLVCRRAKAPQRGKWSLPGGHVKLGESLLDAAARELFEETALGVPKRGAAVPVPREEVPVRASEALGSVKFDRAPFYATDAIYEDEQGATAHHFVIVQLRAWADERMVERAAAGSDASALRWATTDELAALRAAGQLLGRVEAVVERSERLVEARLLSPESAVEVFV
eukprot:Selendium_serpulae@DN5344_c1_g1_i1.p1